jgi:hypothetical protein
MLSQHVGEKETLLSDTACMSPRMRKVYALLAVAEKRSKRPKMKEKIQEAKEIIQALGYAEWLRDIISDMGLKLPTKETKGSLGNVEDIAELFKREADISDSKVDT